jgi:ribA/ribD-fused uncharacterized protein
MEKLYMNKSFQGELDFLSNFYPCDVWFEGVLYPSSEHAFAAAKTLDLQYREAIRQCKTAGQAKRMGREVSLRLDWDKIRVDIMHTILYSKFMDNPELRKKLVKTYPTELVEVNYWGDTFWGVCEGVGENHLGKLLMELRSAPEFYLYE